MSDVKLLIEKQGIKLKKLAHLLLTAEDVKTIADTQNFNIFDSPVCIILSTLYAQGVLSSQEGKDALVALQNVVNLLRQYKYKFPRYNLYLKSIKDSPEVESNVTPSANALATPIRELRQRIEQEVRKSGSPIKTIGIDAFLARIKSLESALVNLNYEKASKEPYRDLHEKSKAIDSVYDKIAASINSRTGSAAGMHKISVSTVATGYSSRRVPLVVGFGKVESVKLEPDMLAVPPTEVKTLREMSQKYASSNGKDDTFQLMGSADVASLLPLPDESRLKITIPLDKKLLESVGQALVDNGEWHNNGFRAGITLSWIPKEKAGEVAPDPVPYAHIGIMVPNQKGKMVSYDPSNTEHGYKYEGPDATLVFHLSKRSLLRKTDDGDYEIKPARSLIATIRLFLSESRKLASSVGIPQSLEVYPHYYDLSNYLDDLSTINKGAGKYGKVSIVKVPWNLEEAEEDGLPLASVSIQDTDSMFTNAIISPMTSTQFSGFLDFDQDYRMMILWAHRDSGQQSPAGRSYAQHAMDILRRNRKKLAEIMEGSSPLVQRTKGGARYAFEEPFSARAVASRMDKLVDAIDQINRELRSMEQGTRMVREPPSSLADEDFGFMHES